MITGITIGDLLIDCNDAQELSDFYAGLLGWERLVMYDMPALRSPEGFVLLFAAEPDYATPVWPEEDGKQQKQMHIDFQVDDVGAAVKQAEALGAVKTALQFGGQHFTTMLDPAGHPFCLCYKG